MSRAEGSTDASQSRSVDTSLDTSQEPHVTQRQMTTRDLLRELQSRIGSDDEESLHQLSQNDEFSRLRSALSCLTASDGSTIKKE